VNLALLNVVSHTTTHFLFSFSLFLFVLKGLKRWKYKCLRLTKWDIVLLTASQLTDYPLHPWHPWHLLHTDPISCCLEGCKKKFRFQILQFRE
jgi:hypothetical protein